MRDSTLQLFVDDLNDIREYMRYIDLVNGIEINNRVSEDAAIIDFRQHLHSFGVSKKLFEYKSITISLYGVLEKHVGLWIREYVNNLPKLISNYSGFSEKFRDDHFQLSVKLLMLVIEKKSAKYEGLKREQILARLSSCIDTPLDFELNGDAFYLHSGNLKHSKIVEAFNYLDIKLTNRLKAVGQRKGGFLCGGPSNIASKGDELFSLIDELVARRNDIAHGENIDDILNVSGFSVYVNFLEEYGRAVFQTLVEREIQFEADFLYRKIENVKGIFKAGSVLCFEIENNEICIGDNIIVQLNDGGYLKKEILGIQKDNQDFERLVVTFPENIGVKLGKGLSKGQIFFIKK